MSLNKVVRNRPETANRVGLRQSGSLCKTERMKKKNELDIYIYKQTKTPPPSLFKKSGRERMTKASNPIKKEKKRKKENP